MRYRQPAHRWSDEDYLSWNQQELVQGPHPNDPLWWRESRINQVSILSQTLNGTFPYEFESIKERLA